MRRPASKARPVQYSDTRTLADESLFGTCEVTDCDRRARAHCARCDGDYCLTHGDHLAHSATEST